VIMSFDSINQLICVMEMCCVFCEVRSECLNIYTLIDFRGLNYMAHMQPNGSTVKCLSIISEGTMKNK
jgi:hypothetical protein